MTLAEIRKEIDRIDPQIKALFLQRMEAAKHVAEVKYAAGDEIYKADREAEILARLSEDVAPELKIEYTAFVRKMMEVARKYEYGLIYDWNSEVVQPILAEAKESGNGYVKMELVRPNQLNGLSVILTMIGDYGFHLKDIKVLEESQKEVRFGLVIHGKLQDEAMEKLLYQLSKESKDFHVL